MSIFPLDLGDGSTHGTTGSGIFPLDLNEIEENRTKDDSPKESIFGEFLKDVADGKVSPLDAFDRSNPEFLGGHHSGHRVKTLAEILPLADEPVNWLVEDFVRAGGGLSIWGGMSKVGKTTFCRQFALAVSRGEKFLDRQCCQKRVCWLLLEGDSQDMALSLRRQGATPDDEGFVIVDDYGYLGDISYSKKVIESVIKDSGCELLVIDTIGFAVGNINWNEYGELNEALGPILNLADEHKVHIAMLHHANKSKSEDPGIAISGSTALSGITSLNVLLYTKEEDEERHRYISTTHRSRAKPFWKHRLHFDTETETATLEEAVVQRPDSDDSDILYHLKKSGSLTQDQLHQLTQIPKRQLGKILTRMQKERLVLRTGDGNDAYRYFILKH